MKRAFATCAAAGLIACLALAGCSSNGGAMGSAGAAPQGSSVNQSESKGGEKDSIKVDEIDWSVEDGIIDGNRRVVFNYTNNSDYLVCGIKMEFRQRDDVTDEDRAVYNSIYENNEFWQEMNGGPEELYITASCMQMVDPGEAVDSVRCTFNSTSTSVESMDQYELMEPSLLSIAYLANGKKYVEYYDYGTGKYSLDSKSGEAANEWDESGISEVLPEPDSQLVVDSYSSSSYYSVNVYGFDREAYEAYVASCKDAGFTTDPYESDAFYSAENDSGDNLSLSYDASDEELAISLQLGDGQTA